MQIPFPCQFSLVIFNLQQIQVQVWSEWPADQGNPQLMGEGVTKQGRTWKTVILQVGEY